jgi:HD superfamily phosphohydrolase
MEQAETTDYFKILSPDFPDWLNDYIDTKELQTQKYISVTCGTIYTDLFNNHIFFSSLDHSIAVALIVWHFTHDKKQTLAGLFHDISTPAFKHCVDFLNGDYEKQESTEALTTEFIKKSGDVVKLLQRDHIKIEEIDDYHIYPIADNDTPKLSADRLEYSLSNALFVHKLLTLDEIKEIYEDIEIEKNESGEIELGFKTKSIARKFVQVTSKMSVVYRDDRTRFSMQLIADILKGLKDEGKITIKDLYDLGESEIISIIENSKYKDVFNTWRKARKIHASKERPKNTYSVHQKVKVRYIDPLCNGERMSKICKIARNAINKNLSYDMDSYVFLDFDLEK